MSRPKIYTWGEWRLEPVEHRLMRADELITLPGKTLDLLTLLVSRAPRLVTKEEILAEVWPAAAVEEGNIAFHVNALRKTIDEACAESCIETVRGRGYRFVAPVKATPAVIPPSTQSLDLPPEVKAMPIAISRRFAFPRMAAMWALAVLIVGTVGFLAFKTTRPAPIVVAPFEVDDAGGAGNDLGASLAPLVVSALSQSGVNAVVKDHESTGEQVLTALLTYTAEKRWNVSLRLARVSDGSVLWSWRFDAPDDERRAQLREQIAKRVADGLKSYLTLSKEELATR